MIKKNTKFVFKDKNNKKINSKMNLIGGIPLSKGEIVSFRNKGSKIIYVVADKKIDCIVKGKDQLVNITYILKET